MSALDRLRERLTWRSGDVKVTPPTDYVVRDAEGRILEISADSIRTYAAPTPRQLGADEDPV